MAIEPRVIWLSRSPVTDCYWLMKQWHSRIKQDRPYINELNLKQKLCRWHIARWRLNMDRSELAVKQLGNSIMTMRVFQHRILVVAS